MKKYIENQFSLPVLIAGLGFITAGPVAAQTFTNLYNFTLTSTNRDAMMQKVKTKAAV